MSVIQIGGRYGKLTVIDLVAQGNANQRKYLCICDCGNKKVTSEDNLRRGHTRSCGCLRCGHGGSKKKNIPFDSSSKLYQVWLGIRMRCFNPKNHNYKNYGARGIGMCDEWKDSYDAFRKWALANGYTNMPARSISIERLDVNGDYCPENCKWATPKEQMNNTRRNTTLEYNGSIKTLMQWAETFGMNYSTFMSRYSRGWSIDKIANTPVRIYGRVV